MGRQTSLWKSHELEVRRPRGVTVRAVLELSATGTFIGCVEIWRPKTGWVEHGTFVGRFAFDGGGAVMQRWPLSRSCNSSIRRAIAEKIGELRR